MLKQAVRGFHRSRSVSCHTPAASSHWPVAVASNASVRTDRFPSARALAYRAGQLASAPGAHAGHQRLADVGDDP
ncbi:hypothetical protein [Streptomyces sp. NPDC055287]